MYRLREFAPKGLLAFVGRQVQPVETHVRLGERVHRVLGQYRDGHGRMQLRETDRGHSGRAAPELEQFATRRLVEGEDNTKKPVVHLGSGRGGHSAIYAWIARELIVQNYTAKELLHFQLNRTTGGVGETI